MKNTILNLTVIFSLTTLICKAQILPVEHVINYINQDSGIPENTTYIKDVNHLFDEFIGTWTGSHNSKTYELQITKITETLIDIQEDLLLVRHKITDNNGNVIDDTTNLSDNNPLVIHGYYFLENGETYRLSYYGVDSNCGQEGNVYLTVINSSPINNPQMDFYFTQKHDTRDPNECLEDITFPFPVETQLILTKQ